MASADTPSPLARKVWLVTGASSGFGRLVTERALELGDCVVATLRDVSKILDLSDKYPASQLLVLQLDVSDSSAITDVFNQAISVFGRIDVVFNNAGYYVVAEIETISDQNSRSMFDVMLWGSVNVMRQAVRCFREVNRPMGGWVLNISSRTALIPQAGNVFYASAKAALEAITEGYAIEVDPRWNIKFAVIEPALFRTHAVSNCVIEPPLPVYASNPSLPSMQFRALHPGFDKAQFDGDPNKFVDVIFRFLATDGTAAFTRLPVHRLAIATAKRKGELLVAAAEKLAHWSDDIYFDKPAAEAK